MISLLFQTNFFFANFLLTVDRAPGYPHPHPEGYGADVDTVADADLEKRQELLFPEYLYNQWIYFSFSPARLGRPRPAGRGRSSAARGGRKNNYIFKKIEDIYGEMNQFSSVKNSYGGASDTPLLTTSRHCSYKL